MAAYTLFDLTYRTARELGVVFEGTATSGGSGTIDDTVWLSGFEDDEFNRGTVWLLWDAGGAGAPPEGQYARVTDFAKATSRITHVPFVGANAAAGDRYAVCGRKYPLDILIQAINSTLQDIYIRYTDTTTVVPQSGKTEYDLPAGVLDEGIEVSIQANSDSDDNQWYRIHDWYIYTDGTNRLLIFRHCPPVGKSVKITYWIPHPPLRIYSDTLRESVSLERVVYEAAYRCLIWRSSQPGEGKDLQGKIEEMYARMMQFKKIQPGRSKLKLATVGLVDNPTYWKY